MRSQKISFLSAASLILVCGIVCQDQSADQKMLFPIEKDGKWGFIDRSGKLVISVQFDSANEFHEGLALVTAGEKKLFIDASGRVVMEPKFDIVNDFSEGLAAVNIGQTRIANIGLIANPGKWGYIDKTGALVLPMKFTHAENFSEGLAAVTLGDRDHGAFIYRAGKIAFEIPLDVTLGFHEGVAGVLLNGSIIYYERTGKKIPISTEYGPKSNSFSDGLLPIEVKSKWGFVDRTGKIVIEPRFEDADNFSDGLAAVKVRGEEKIWCPRDENGSREGFTMKLGYIDKTGELVIPAQFESASPFSEGLAEIHQCDKSFFIDKTGKTVLSGNFRYASSFAAGLARVSIMRNGKLLESYIDKSGKIIWDPMK